MESHIGFTFLLDLKKKDKQEQDEIGGTTSMSNFFLALCTTMSKKCSITEIDLNFFQAFKQIVNLFFRSRETK